MRFSVGLCFIALLSLSLIVGVIDPMLRQGSLNSVRGQTPKKVDEIVNQYVSLYPSEVGDPLKACGAAATWSESVTYDGTQELHTIKGEFHFVPDRLRALWKAFLVDTSTVAGGWERQDIREKDPTIASSAGLTLSSTSDIVVRPSAPGTAQVTYSLIAGFPEITYKFTCEYDVYVQEQNVHNSQVVYVIIGRAHAVDPLNTMWVLAPPPTYGADILTLGNVAVPAYPFYVEFELRSRKEFGIVPQPSIFETARTEFSSRTVTTNTHFLLKWGSAWGGGQPAGSPIYDYKPDFVNVYKDEMWKVEKSTQVKLSNPPNPPTQGTPSGPSAYFSASTGVKATLRVSTTDPDGHSLMYFMDCNGDGKIDQDEYALNSPEEHAPVASGQMATVWGLWKTAGTYTARIVVLDGFGGEAWSPLITVTVSATDVSTTTSTASTSMSHSTVTSISLVMISRTTTQQGTSFTRTRTTQRTSTLTSSYTTTMRTTPTRTVHQTTTAGAAPRTITSTRTTYTTIGTTTQTSWRTSTMSTSVDVTVTISSLSTSEKTVTTVTQQLPSSVLEKIQVIRTVYVQFIQRILHNDIIQIDQIDFIVRYALITPVVEVLIIHFAPRHYGPLPTEADEPTILDTLTENAPLIAIATVSIIAACLFVMKKRGVKPSGIHQWIARLRKKSSS